MIRLEMLSFEYELGENNEKQLPIGLSLHCAPPAKFIFVFLCTIECPIKLCPNCVTALKE